MEQIVQLFRLGGKKLPGGFFIFIFCIMHQNINIIPGQGTVGPLCGSGRHWEPCWDSGGLYVLLSRSDRDDPAPLWQPRCTRRSDGVSPRPWPQRGDVPGNAGGAAWNFLILGSTAERCYQIPLCAAPAGGPETCGWSSSVPGASGRGGEG